MTAAHFIADDLDGDIVRLVGEEARHAARALRVRPGEQITVTDGRGTVVEATCTAADARELVAEVRARRTVEPVRPRIVLMPAVPKAGKLDLVVQKATEIGVAAIIGWIGARSVVRWDPRRIASATERLRLVARAATKQSRRAWLPEVDIVGSIPQPGLPSIVLHEASSASLSSILPADAPEEIAIVVGPEGGLDDAEVESLRASGAKDVSLGEAIMRAETAAIVAPALVLGHYGGLG